MSETRGTRGSIEIDGDRRVFAPGEEISGTASWWLHREPRRVELVLHWRTEGAGERDAERVEVLPVERPRNQGHQSFRFRLPDGPYSFSGKLTSVVWRLDLVAKPGGTLDRKPVTVSPYGQEVLLHETRGGGGSGGTADGGTFTASGSERGEADDDRGSGEDGPEGQA